jgi:hypothetical protein
MRRLAGLAALVIATSCDALSPGNDPIVVYDVTTTLDSFSFETAAPSLPDCPSHPAMPPYCTHVRAFEGATLSGVLTLKMMGDSVVPSGSFTGLMCSSIDYAGLTGCTAVAQRSDEYGPWTPSAIYKAGGDSLASIHLRVGSGLDYKPILSLSGPMLGDSIIGTVLWAAAPGRSPPTHSGRFVARRR